MISLWLLEAAAAMEEGGVIAGGGTDKSSNFTTPDILWLVELSGVTELGMIPIRT